jgi:hypothetical protein
MFCKFHCDNLTFNRNSTVPKIFQEFFETHTKCKGVTVCQILLLKFVILSLDFVETRSTSFVLCKSYLTMWAAYYFCEWIRGRGDCTPGRTSEREGPRALKALQMNPCLVIEQVCELSNSIEQSPS